MDFFNEYSQKNQDTKSVDIFIKNLMWSQKNILASYLKQVKQRVAGSLGSYTIIGNKNDVLEQLNEIYKAKTSGVALTFYDYKKDLNFFGKNILKRIRSF